jgi:hypothetical protein
VNEHTDTIPAPPPSGVFEKVNPPIKQCACGISFDLAEWCGLKLVGRQIVDEETFELRNCPCGSTLSIQISEREGVTELVPEGLTW